MRLIPICAAAGLVLGVSSASAIVTDNNGPYTVAYDETTDFGYLAGSFSSGGSPNRGFNWTVPPSANVSNFGSSTTVTTVNLPSFTVTANAGWALSDIQAFLGNLVFTEVGSTTGILIYADVAVNGGPAVSLSGGVGWTLTGGGPGFLLGYFGETFGPVAGGFQSVSVSNARIALSASGGTFGSISAQPQNRLEISFNAQPVPEPETYAMLLAGLGALGWLTKRRQNQG